MLIFGQRYTHRHWISDRFINKQQLPEPTGIARPDSAVGVEELEGRDGDGSQSNITGAIF